jgi:hypothetical protein
MIVISRPVIIRLVVSGRLITHLADSLLSYTFSLGDAILMTTSSVQEKHMNTELSS